MANPRIFVGADVIFCGAASPMEQGASHVTLLLAEVGLIDAVTSQQAVVEVERNLAAKMPKALLSFRHLIDRSLRIVPEPVRSVPFHGRVKRGVFRQCHLWRHACDGRR